MPPAEFSFRIQHGIVGGFAPPRPSAIHTFTAPLNQSLLHINSSVRPDGTPALQDLAPRTRPLTDADTAPLIDELHAILKTIPTEYPPGSEDIYGLDTSIAWGSEDLEWINGGPQGCGGGTSERQATEEEKAKFKRAVQIVTELAGEEEG